MNPTEPTGRRVNATMGATMLPNPSSGYGKHSTCHSWDWNCNKGPLCEYKYPEDESRAFLERINNEKGEPR